ncbi:MAG: hypothetical protein HY706_12695 [Candidatus Hydrogenedentes bacterium]|nr:hypothetical protein [Candidatus Hydrogenedentota bacterium]
MSGAAHMAYYRCFICHPAILFSAILFFFACRSVSAHEDLGELVQHRLDFNIGLENVDICVDLTFHAALARTERLRADINGDGELSGQETTGYLKRVAEETAAGIQLRVNDCELAVVPLYEPQVDWLQDSQAGSHSLTLSLFYFVRTPPVKTSEVVLQIKDRLWPNAAAMCLVEAQGQKDMRATVLHDFEALSKPGQPRVFRVQWEARKENSNRRESHAEGLSRRSDRGSGYVRGGSANHAERIPTRR